MVSVFMSVTSAFDNANLIVMEHEQMKGVKLDKTKLDKFENRMDSTLHVLKCYVKLGRISAFQQFF